MSTSVIAPKEPSKSSREKWNPNRIQEEAMKFLAAHAPACGLFLDPGCGKTSTALRVFAALRRQRLCGAALVVAPLRVCYEVWPAETAKWDFAKGLRTSILHGFTKEIALQTKADLYLVNHEGLGWFFSHPDILKKLGIELLIADESSKFKNTHTLRFKTVKPYLGQFKYRWLLTGSPAPNGLIDVFGQMYVCDLGETFGPYVTHFRSQYFQQSGYGGYTWELSDGSAAKIYRKLKNRTVRLDTKDYAKLPKRMDSYIRVELSNDGRRAYQEMEREFYAQLKGGASVAALSASSKGIKLRQMTNGAVYVDENHNWAEACDAKLAALADLIDELAGVPAIVAYEFDHDRQRIQKLLGEATPCIFGGMPPQRTGDICHRWNTGEIQVLLAQSATIAYGLNLQGGPGQHIIWFGLTWNFEIYDQLIRRLIRQGSRQKRIFVHHLVAIDTIDEAVVQALQKKECTQNALFEALKNFRK